MSYAVCRMQKVKSAGLKGMQFHNQRERKSRTNDDIDHERTRENYDLKNDKNIDYNERVKEIIESQKTGTRKTRKDAVLVNELLVTSDRDFFEQLDPGEQKRFFEESYKLFSERYGKQNIAYATVHNDEQTPHMHLGVVINFAHFHTSCVFLSSFYSTIPTRMLYPHNRVSKQTSCDAKLEEVRKPPNLRCAIRSLFCFHHARFYLFF